jgi:hypothetical protein
VINLNCGKAEEKLNYIQPKKKEERKRIINTINDFFVSSFSLKIEEKREIIITTTTNLVNNP